MRTVLLQRVVTDALREAEAAYNAALLDCANAGLFVNIHMAPHTRIKKTSVVVTLASTTQDRTVRT